EPGPNTFNVVDVPDRDPARANPQRSGGPEVLIAEAEDARPVAHDESVGTGRQPPTLALAAHLAGLGKVRYAVQPDLAGMPGELINPPPEHRDALGEVARDGDEPQDAAVAGIDAPQVRSPIPPRALV